MKEQRDWRIGFKQIDGVVVEWQKSYTWLTLGDLCPEFINEKMKKKERDVI